MALLDVKPKLIVSMFDEVFYEEKRVAKWSRTIISPIIKSSIEMYPGNYRSIFILSYLGILYFSV